MRPFASTRTEPRHTVPEQWSTGRRVTLKKPLRIVQRLFASPRSSPEAFYWWRGQLHDRKGEFDKAIADCNGGHSAQDHNLAEAYWGRVECLF